jgi:hypothetical protein
MRTFKSPHWVGDAVVFLLNANCHEQVVLRRSVAELLVCFNFLLVIKQIRTHLTGAILNPLGTAPF